MGTENPEDPSNIENLEYESNIYQNDENYIQYVSQNLETHIGNSLKAGFPLDEYYDRSEFFTACPLWKKKMGYRFSIRRIIRFARMLD